jgi:hypothetical protein
MDVVTDISLWVLIKHLKQWLTKRCDIKGKYWADPVHYDSEFLNKADVGLERMEQLARQMVPRLSVNQL